MNDEIGSKITKHGEIGKGGFGTVYKCSDERGNVFVSKICDTTEYGIPSPMELSIMSTFDHPYINKCIKIHCFDKSIYIFQKLALSDLSRLVRKDKIESSNYKPNNRDIKEWILMISSALKCLHENKIIHADIKASNILIFDNNDKKIAKLSDFTVSVKLQNDNSTFNHKVCTSTHRPIENFLGKEWDYSLDIWCLGVTIYEIIYGRLLFPNQNTIKKDEEKDNDPENKLDHRRKVKDHIDERFINCILDWADNGPVRQDHMYVNYTNYKYNRFDLSPEFYNDPFKINDILLRMLMVDPTERPTINKLMKYPFFSGNVNVEYDVYNIKSYLDNLSSARKKKIHKICSKLGIPISIQKNIMCLYASFDNNGQSKSIKLYSCILICCKIYRYKLPNISVDLERVIKMERDICTNIKFRLHVR